MVEVENCVLVVIDVQGKLAQLMWARQHLFKNIRILIKSSKILNIPIIWTQQSPESLGETIPLIAELLGDEQPVNKASFSCCREGKFLEKLKALKRSHVVLCGIEAHVCIYQTAVDLLSKQYDVAAVSDAVSSRTNENSQAAIDRMRQAGVTITTTEMIIFELLKTAENPHFKEVSKLVK